MGQHFIRSVRVYALKIPFLRTLFFFTCVNAPSQKHRNVSGNQPLARLLKLTSFGFMLFKFYAAEALKPLSCLITQHLFIFGVSSTEHAETGKSVNSS